VTTVPPRADELTLDDWRRAMDLLDEALDVDESARDAWLHSVDGERAALVPAVRALLRRRETLDPGFLRSLPSFTSGNGDDDDGVRAGDEVGPFRVLERLGRGGMGTVWLAERTDGLLARRVALKLPRTGVDRAEFAVRLERERDLLASLEHPNVARLYDAGVTTDGRPWLALEFVRGVPIDRWCADHRLDAAQRVDLVRQVAGAVAYAHSRLIVHRDLKPANVLVADDGSVRLLDFGIGKLLEADGTGETRLGPRPMTPDYASPEQRGASLVTTATDVYSLGVVLYELLAGRRPPADAVPPPSSSDPALLASGVDRDLDAVVLRALEPQPEDRYPTMAAFDDDLARWRRGDVVAARSGSAWHRATKFARRHRTAVLAASVAVVALAAGGSIAAWQAGVARDAAASARGEAVRARAVQSFLVSIFSATSRDEPDPERARATTVRELLDRAANRLQAPDGGGLPEDAQDELRATLAGLYNELGLGESSIPLLQARIARLRAAGPLRELDLARQLVSLAHAMQSGPRFAEALPVLREAESIARRHPEDARVNGYVASYLANQLVDNAPAEARAQAARATTLLRVAEPDGDERLGALLMLANVARSDDPALARASALEATELAARRHGRDSQLYAELAMFLADLQGATLLAADADATFRSAEAAALHATPPGHYVRLQIDLRWGLLLADLDRREEARERLERVLDVATRTYGANDTKWVGWAHENLARAALRDGRFDVARREGDESLRIVRVRPPDDVRAKLAELTFDAARATGDRAAARALLDEARIARTATGTIHGAGFREAVALREAELRLDDGDAAGAVPLFRTVADAAVPEIQRFVSNRLRARVGLATALLAGGDPRAATGAAQAVLDEIERRGSPAALRPEGAAAHAALAAVAVATRDCAAARRHRDAARALLEITDVPGSPRRRALDQAAACAAR
jgi:tetratricopeptide (TPR) repeat protein